MAEVWPLLRLKCESEASGSSTAEVVQQGEHVMVYAEPTNKGVLPEKTAPVVRRLSGRRYEVRWSGTHVQSVEKVANMLRLTFSNCSVTMFASFSNSDGSGHFTSKLERK
jgi:hypothetical protein